MIDEEIAMSEGGGMELCIEILACSWHDMKLDSIIKGFRELYGK